MNNDFLNKFFPLFQYSFHLDFFNEFRFRFLLE